MAASGAAFTAVVLGQMATALACRSSSRTIAEVGLRGNRLLIGAIAAELGALVLFLMWQPLADLLDHQIPTLLGFAVATWRSRPWRRRRSTKRWQRFRRANDVGTLALVVVAMGSHDQGHERRNRRITATWLTSLRGWQRRQRHPSHTPSPR